MSKIIYYTASSIDGFIADENDGLDWLFQFGDVNQTDYPEFISSIGAAAMGANTYRWLWEHHFQDQAPNPIPWPYNFPVMVFSHHSQPLVPRADIRMATGAVSAAFNELETAACGKNVWILGGGDLAAQFVDAALIDEMWVTYAPVCLGRGKPLLPLRLANPPLRTLATHRFGDHFVQVKYSLRTESNPMANEPLHSLRLRPATLSDVSTLRGWEAAPHLAGLLGDDDWQWEKSLAARHPAHDPFIAEIDGRPVGFLEILDPSRDPDRYWGDLPPGYRAIDLWIGEPDFLGKGLGRAMMRKALAICFTDKDVHTVLVDPLASNTAAHRFYERCGFRFFEERLFGEDHCFVFQIERSVWEALA